MSCGAIGKGACRLYQRAEWNDEASGIGGSAPRGHGIEGDAHAGPWHRQGSLLATESVEPMRAVLPELPAGAFAENILIEGLELKTLPIGTRLRVGGALLEVTQIGKECHKDCAIRQQIGDCVMPHEGIFARVLIGGAFRPGDPVTVE